MTDRTLNPGQRAILDLLIRRFPELAPIEGTIVAGYELIKGCYDAGGKVLLSGNGGSCADAEHIAGELLKGFVKKRPVRGEAREQLLALGEDGALLAERLQEGLPAIPLNIPALSTAALNDLGGEMHFAQQVMALGNRGDVLIGISTSGNARNIHLASLTAKAKGMRVLGLTGAADGLLGKDADVNIAAPATETYQIQELHLPIYHALCAMLEEAFFEV